jgi:hypothetical protein
MERFASTFFRFGLQADECRLSSEDENEEAHDAGASFTHDAYARAIAHARRSQHKRAHAHSTMRRS